MKQASNQKLDPLAIVGIGCHFPGGANSAEQYWDLLIKGQDAISETPESRWSLKKFYEANQSLPGKTQSKWGGYVDGLDEFDPQFFGISPREAASMDPQQRLLLASCFRAFEDAGHPPTIMAGKDVAVFMGISSFDYAVAGLSYQDRGVIDAYSNTGGSSSIAANRISYCFDLRGPSVAVDTACSSSLVALHMACESIWRGDAQFALAGGVNALILPDFYVAFSQLGVLSPDGRCKTFDSRANGYVRSEGAGAILLKPLSAALRDQDFIYSVIRATALNQDGRTPGMTVPSEDAQRALIGKACDKAGIQPSDVSYVEAHGTGTPVGDPIEARAIGSALAAHRSADDPLYVGSVKTNIGHLEAGAGIASVIKVALAMHHQQIPKHLNFNSPNPDIDFAGLNIQVPSSNVAWNSENRIAGINGFGYGGANAHVIMEQAPESATQRSVTLAVPNSALTSTDEQTIAPVLLPVSGQSKAALLESSSQLANWLKTEGGQLPLAETASYLAHRRAHFQYRATVCGSSRNDIIEQLENLAASTPEELASQLGDGERTESSQTESNHTGPSLAFVCSGQGPQWWAMGRGLLMHSPAFRSVISRCDEEFRKHGSWSLLTELQRSEETSRMQQTSIAQPSIFAIQIALAELWKSWGIEPQMIVGHSVGEIAAAYLSGSLSFEDAACVAFHRGRTMDLATSQGAMVAAGLSANEVPSWLDGIEDQVALAAINGPTSVTISGDKTAIEGLVTRLEKAGVFCRQLAVEYAFHSPQMEPVREELLNALSHIKPRQSSTPIVSTVTGDLIDGTQLDANYWWQNVRQAVRFSDAIEVLAEKGTQIAVEIGPHPVLAYSINECFQTAGKSVKAVPSLNRKLDDLSCISKSLGTLYTLGCNINWRGFYTQPTRKVPAPKYPFQLRRCWSESFESETSRTIAPANPLLGELQTLPVPTWQQRIDLKNFQFLSDHCVRGSVIYPAAAMLECSLAAAHELDKQRNFESNAAPNDFQPIWLKRVQFRKPCDLREGDAQHVMTQFDRDRQVLQQFHREADNDHWSELTVAEIATFQTSSEQPSHSFSKDVDAIRNRCNENFDAERLYSYCERLGLEYGASFRGILSGLRRDGEALAEVSLSDNSRTRDFLIHPALLDSCFHAMIAADPLFDHQLGGLYLPAEIQSFELHRRPTERVLVHAKLLNKTDKVMRCNIEIATPQGECVASIRGFESRRVSGGIENTHSTQDLIYGYKWIESNEADSEIRQPNQALPEQASVVVFMDESGLGKELIQRLQQQGLRALEIYQTPSQVAQSNSAGFQQVDPENRDSMRNALLSAIESSENCIGCVYLWALDAPANAELDCNSLRSSSHATSLAPLHLLQSIQELEKSLKEDFSLTLVTSCAQSQDQAIESVCVSQSPLIGLGRVAISEISRVKTRLVDLPDHPKAQDVACLAGEIGPSDDEDEILLRDGKRYVRRFVPLSELNLSNEGLAKLPSQLQIGSTAGVEEMHYASRSNRQLNEGEVEIEVLATGLNFSDVMKALDLYPGLPDGPVALGAECAGRISRVGPQSDWQVGDEVFAVAPGSFGTHTIVNSELVARKPGNLSFNEAAALPIAFLTAHYALFDCARLQSGDSLLLHSASGGVGLAAMQLATKAGIKVYATAGTPEKRQFVRQLGATAVMDSRSLDFGRQTLEATNGQGVDAVLNSLPGEAIKVGLSTLKVGGKFLEIGKRDIYNDAALGLFPFRNNLALFAIDLDQLFKQRPRLMGDKLRELAHAFEHEELRAIPIETFPASETQAAFKQMQQGKHIGKLVVEYQQPPQSVRAGDVASLSFEAEATYWLAGGLGGFGLEIARWLASRGVRSLVLGGRSQQVRPEVMQVINELIEQGVRVTIQPTDITKPEEVQRTLDRIDQELPPLKGIFHTAMILEDKLIADLDRPTLERVLWPKVLGGWNLHEATKDRPLETFVLFSSLSSVFGHAGQANYSAANAALDSLAHYRRANNLPATVINWGHVGDAGYLAEREELGQRLERQGVLSFSIKEATRCLEFAIQTYTLQMSVLKMDWTLWRGLGLTNRVSPRFAGLLRHHDNNGGTEGEQAIHNVRAVTGLQREAVVLGLLRSKSASLLGIATDDIDPERGLLELGLDSLMAVEMRNWIEGNMEIDLPISSLMRSNSISELVRTACDLIDQSLEESGDHPGNTSNFVPSQNPSEASETQTATDLLGKVDNLSENEVDSLLSQLLSGDSSEQADNQEQ